MTSLHSARSRLAQLRNKLHAELAQLKSSSTKHKKTEGRLGGVMDCIQILDEELLADEQGRAIEQEFVDLMLAHRNTGGLRPDQVAWLNARRGE